MQYLQKSSSTSCTLDQEERERERERRIEVSTQHIRRMSTSRESELERLVDAATMAAIGLTAEDEDDDISFTQEQEQEQDVPLPLKEETSAAQDNIHNEDQISFASSDSFDENRWLQNDDISLSPDMDASLHSSSSSSCNEIPCLLIPTYEKPLLEIKSNLHMFELPLDALHAIASFLTLEEWRNFGLINRDASLACREILQKVKMHSFLCAVEVVTTWVSLNVLYMRNKL